ncbi:MAG: helix-turn-helix transcriptional regulator [Imperialibacter sp.]|uniref:helix-turn-helix transcriptional regulator n=1 Tax=Imperialibacter sp. TaxID=2038411 RepID=UPI0032EF0657
MNSIPNIAFQSTKDATDIEFLTLSELFSRIDDAPDHNPRLPHRLSFFALLIVTRGTGSHQVDLKKYPLTQGAVIKIAKGQVHAFQENLSYDGVLLAFTEEFVLKYFSRSSVDFITHLYNYHISEPLVDNCTFNDFFLEQIDQEIASNNTYAQKEIIAKIVELYLLRLERLSYGSLPSRHSKSHYALFIQFKNLVESRELNSRNVKDYAESMSLSAKHLNSIVRQFTLNTAKSFIDQYVILEVKRTIMSSRIGLKEVAYQMGFDEVTNFTKFFKKHTGVSPKQYRASL